MRRAKTMLDKSGNLAIEARLLDSRTPSWRWDKTVAGLAQLVEQLICNHQAEGSNPSAGTSFR